ncbi:MAG: hypothetical protein WD250_08310 [Egibacteraceae bacterium]
MAALSLLLPLLVLVRPAAAIVVTDDELPPNAERLIEGVWVDEHRDHPDFGGVGREVRVVQNSGGSWTGVVEVAHQPDPDDAFPSDDEAVCGYEFGASVWRIEEYLGAEHPDSFSSEPTWRGYVAGDRLL